MPSFQFGRRAIFIGEIVMAMNYNQTLSNLRDAIADIQTALNHIGLDGSQSMAQWASQLETVSSTIQGLRDQISADDTDFENIYDAIVQKGQSPDEENRDTYAPAILAISGGGSGVLDTLSVTPSTQAQSITPPAGTDGYNRVNVSAVDASIDSDIVAGNIKSGVEILGVVGQYSGGSNYQSKSVTPTAAGLTVTPDTGYDALSSVVIAGDQQLIASNIKKDVEIFGVTGTLEGGGVQLNPHPTDLQYAGARASGHTDILPADGSWTTAVDLTAMTNTSGMRYLFYGNTVVEDIDLSGWTLPSGTSANYWFAGCTNLKHVRGSLSFANTSSFNSMFDQCSSLITCPITNFGFGLSTNTITLDLSASAVLDAHTLITNMDTNNSGKTRILKLHSTVRSGLSSADIALAASKNITLQ
jgi:hypothetical protein